MVIVDVYDLFMVVRAHLKITFKDKDGFNLGSWCLGKWMIKHRDHRSVLSWVLYLSSDRYLVLCLSADRYLVLYLCLPRSAAQHSVLVCQRARRIAIHSIFSPTERVMRWWIAVSGNFLWIILLSSFLKVFGVKDHDGDQPVCLKCNSFSIAPNTKCSWVLLCMISFLNIPVNH